MLSFDKALGGGRRAQEARNPMLLGEFARARQAFDSSLRSGRISNNLAAMDAAAIAGGMAFLEAELEKRDPKVREPLTSVTWMRDMIVKNGGGWVEFTSNFFSDYGVAGPNQYGLTGGETTTIPIVQTNLSKDIYPVNNWQNVLKVNFIDMQKAQGAGRSLDDLLDNGIKLNWNKSLDYVTYFGWAGMPGLTNNSNIAHASVATGAGGSTLWSKKTPAEILYDVNTIMTSTVAASQYDVSGMADHILVPWAQFAYISSQLVSSAGNVSILTYLLENNLGKTQGVDLKIFPCRQCLAAGAGGTDRMIAYKNDEEKIYMDVTVPIQRVMTVPSVDNGGGAYLTLYAGQIGVVKFLFPTTASYGDGI